MRFLLDTNVFSELLRARPAPRVLSWVDSQAPDTLFATSITEAEIHTGIAMLPGGRRRDRLTVAANRLFGELFQDRVWPFDRGAAHSYAAIAAGRRAAGRSVSQFDGQIAAIARSRSMALATRNIRDFEECGIEVINPWRTD